MVVDKTGGALEEVERQDKVIRVDLGAAVLLNRTFLVVEAAVLRPLVGIQRKFNLQLREMAAREEVFRSAEALCITAEAAVADVQAPQQARDLGALAAVEQVL